MKRRAFLAAGLASFGAGWALRNAKSATASERIPLPAGHDIEGKPDQFDDAAFTRATGTNETIETVGELEAGAVEEPAHNAESPDSMERWGFHCGDP